MQPADPHSSIEAMRAGLVCVMEGLRDSGAEVVRALEGWRPTFDTFFQVVTVFGEVPFFFVFLAAVYWLVDRDLAVRITIVLSASILTNVWLKEAFGQPRPAAHDPTLSPLIDADSLGFPSGHAQGAVVIWGSMFVAIHRPWVRLASAAALVLVPFSRLYLGVHFPHDLVGGYLVGAALLWAGVRFVPVLIDRFFALSLMLQLVLALGIPISGALLANSPGGARGGAALAGGFIGLVIEQRWIRCPAASDWFSLVMRLLIGFAGVASLWWFLFGDVGVAANSVAAFVIAMWIAAGAPWVFRRVERLRERRPRSRQTI